DCPAAARAATCSGLTLVGPEPNRPSAGSRSAGMTIFWAASDILIEDLFRAWHVPDRPRHWAHVVGTGPDQPPGPLLLQDVSSPACGARAGEHRGEHVRWNLGEVQHDRGPDLHVRGQDAVGPSSVQLVKR